MLLLFLIGAGAGGQAPQGHPGRLQPDRRRRPARRDVRDLERDDRLIEEEDEILLILAAQVGRRL
jgi:hypothetical protein